MRRLKWWLDFVQFWKYRYILTEQGIMKVRRQKRIWL